MVDAQQGVVVDWEVVEKTDVISVDCNGRGRNILPLNDVIMTANGPAEGGGTFDALNSTGTNLNSGPGVAGSMARFAIVSNYLYTIDYSNMTLFDLSDCANPTQWTQVNVGWNIETIFPYQDNLFIGSQTGMHIFDNSNPASPSFISTYEHISSCDPVVVDGDIAYVTLRSGTPCQGFTNQLDVIDISNLWNPTLMTSYDMTNPHGLGIDDNTLFLCDGSDGLKVYDVNDPMKISDNIIKHFQDINTYDVIPFNDVLLMTGADGIYQYDYSDVENLQVLSVISIDN